MPAFKLKLLIIDDVQSGVEQPIFTVKLYTSAARITNWSTNMKVSIVARGLIDYFNAKMSCWEPFLEEWAFTIQVCVSYALL